jgi:hypothetical protein
MKLVWKSWNAELEHQALSEIEDDNEISFDKIIDLDTKSVVFTPVGPYHKDDPMRPSKRWDCFVCYTDFDIGTGEFLDIVSNIEGVEGLDILGNYSFFIGFGKLFDTKKVKERVIDEVTKYVES